MTNLTQIESFLANKRVAIVGVSREPRDFSRTLFREFLAQGYNVVPVNPLVSLIENCHCFASLREINPPVEAVLFMTPPDTTEDVVRECPDAGVKSIWFYRAVGAGAVSANAISFCKEHHIEVIEGHCPMMFLPNPGFPHRVHRFFSRLVGKYPK